jgi:hypothetical protein
MWARIVTALLGVWMMAAPAVLGYGGRAAISDRIAGPLAASFAIVAIWDVVRSLRWVDAPIGLWMIFAPLILGYGGPAAVNGAAVGVVVATLSLVPGRARKELGGGWRSPGEPGTHREPADGQPNASKRGGRE